MEPANRTGTGREATQFKPGQSGNPSGRPSFAKEIRKTAQRYTPECLEKLISIVRNEKAKHADQIKACEVLSKIAGVPTNYTITTEDENGEEKPLSLQVTFMRPESR